MKTPSGPSVSSFVKIRLTVALSALTIIPILVLATTPPSWWLQRGVTAVDGNGNPLPADDFAVANQGQVKQMATQAYAEFQQVFSNIPGGIGNTQGPSGTGYRLTTLINGFNAEIGVTPPAPATDDFAAINLGQLKTIAQPFYDRLIELHILTAYPWANSGTAPDDYSIANLGQLKNMFAFDFTTSSANDGIPDWWKLVYGLNPATNLASTSSGLGTLTYLQVYQAGLDLNAASWHGNGGGNGSGNGGSGSPTAEQTVKLVVFTPLE
jgi:hypothetical protein